MADGGLEETLTKSKIGGVPAWGIGVGLAAVVIGFIAWKNHQASKESAAQVQADATAADTAPVDTTGGSDTSGIDPQTGILFSQEQPFSNVGLSPQGLPGPVTNAQWSRLAFDWLIAKGDDPTVVGNALAKFLAGQPLSDVEQAIVNLAEQTFGAPPEGLLTIQTGGTTGVNPLPSTGPAVRKKELPASMRATNTNWVAQFTTAYDNKSTNPVAFSLQVAGLQGANKGVVLGPGKVPMIKLPAEISVTGQPSQAV